MSRAIAKKAHGAMVRGPRWALAWALLGGACAHAPAPPAGPVPSWPTIEAGLAAARASRQSLCGTARVTYFGPKGRLRLRTVVVAKRPAAFRIEALSPLEQPVQTMVSDGRTLSLLAEQRIRTGQAVPENVARLMPMPLWPEELVDVLMGGVPSRGAFVGASVTAAKDGGWWVEGAPRGARRWSVHVDADLRRVRGARAYEGDALWMEVRFDKFAVLTDGEGITHSLPHRVRVRMPGPDLDVRIRLLDIEVNVPIDEALFRLTPPPGIAPEPF